jgi:hemerythrin superfamily protein
MSGSMEDQPSMDLENQRSIYDLIKDDHKAVKNLFKQIIDSDQYQPAILAQSDHALTIHLEGEEKHFYPRLVNAAETHEMALEAVEEHNAAKQLQNTITNSDPDMRYAKVKVLWEIVEHHMEEEEKHLFKGAKKVLSKEEEKEIGRLFETEKTTAPKIEAPTVM